MHSTPALPRRTLITALLAAGLAPRPARAAPDPLAALERAHGGRLGVAMLDTGSGATWTHRGDERFALCSTFKLLLAAATLAEVDAGRAVAAEVLPLAEAAQVRSDNPAANALLQRLGGPAAFTAWLRAQGDAHTRIDRIEPLMNVVTAGDERDTTTPLAMAASAARVVLGPVLSPASRDRLQGWMVATRTGTRRLRAGLPRDWRAGDKTGTGLDPQTPDFVRDVAVFWPPGGRAPWVVAAYLDGPRRGSARVRPEDEAVLARVGRLAAARAR